MRVAEAIKKIRTAKKVYIYGAGDVAKEVSYCLINAPYFVEISAFVVSDSLGDLERTINGIPVISCETLEISDEILVIIAVLEKYRDEICLFLDEKGMYNRLEMTFESDLWCEVRSKFYELYKVEKEGVPFLQLHDELEGVIVKETTRVEDLTVYVARSHVDKPLKEKVLNAEWEYDIQVGADLSDIRIAEIADNTGDNISLKNKQYCELTALYWMWKNNHSKYVGLCHYRRKFVLSREIVKKLINSDIDVVVTIPVLNVPDVLAMYEKNHKLSDWGVMTRGIEEICSEYLSALKEVEQSKFYVPYNMFIMRRECFEDYCEWLFPILEYCEENCEKKEDRYQNRYIGFLAERLMSVYLLYHQNALRIVYAEKHFYE